jgi:hypothetical protein
MALRLTRRPGMPTSPPCDVDSDMRHVGFTAARMYFRRASLGSQGLYDVDAGDAGGG